MNKLKPSYRSVTAKCKEQICKGVREWRRVQKKEGEKEIRERERERENKKYNTKHKQVMSESNH